MDSLCHSYLTKMKQHTSIHISQSRDISFTQINGTCTIMILLANTTLHKKTYKCHIKIEFIRSLITKIKGSIPYIGDYRSSVTLEVFHSKIAKSVKGSNKNIENVRSIFYFGKIMKLVHFKILLFEANFFRYCTCWIEIILTHSKQDDDFANEHFLSDSFIFWVSSKHLLKLNTVFLLQISGNTGDHSVFKKSFLDINIYMKTPLPPHLSPSNNELGEHVCNKPMQCTRSVIIQITLHNDLGE